MMQKPLAGPDPPAGTSIPDLPATMQPKQTPTPERGRSAWYVSLFLIGFVLLVSSTFVLAGTNWYLWHDGYPGLRHIGFAHRARNMNCEILIFGDSSSLTGLDPKIVSQKTGMSSCNISEGFNIESVAGSDEILQTYLKYNKIPRVLLTTWTPSRFEPDTPKLTTWLPEGVVYAAQYGEWKLIRPSPAQAVRGVPHFVCWMLKTYLSEALDVLTGKSLHQPDVRAERTQRLGQWPYPLPPETHCVRPPGLPLADPEEVRQSVESFRRKWSPTGMVLLLDVSPVPDCDQSFARYQADMTHLPDNALERLPIQYFNEGDVHFSPEGSRYLSEQAAKQVLERLRAADAGTTAKGTHNP